MSRRANADMPDQVEVRVIFDRTTGAILHVHEAVAVGGADFPSEPELARHALECASAMTGRRVEEMETLLVSAADVVLAGFRVDPHSRRLVSASSDR